MIEDEPQREARRLLGRVARESGPFGSSALARSSRRLRDHFAGADAVGTAEDGGTDPAELWGRRIGRALSVIAVILLILWLVVERW